MRNLLNFLIKYNYWLLFLLLEAASIALLVRFNNYQQSVFFTSANAVSGTVYRLSGEVKSYFNLKEDNAVLLQRNTELEQKIAYLEDALDEAVNDSARYAYLTAMAGRDYSDQAAMVVNNSIDKDDNYITIDKGSNDGVRPEMAVVGAGGVVGIVYKTSANYALVISLLNSKSNLSCKIARSDYFGYLKWEGHDPEYAYLKDLPRHAEFEIGDTVVTSGFSAMFPEGVMVGTVSDKADSHDGLSYQLKVKLSTDFSNISGVRVLMKNNTDEKAELERHK